MTYQKCVDKAEAYKASISLQRVQGDESILQEIKGHYYKLDQDNQSLFKSYLRAHIFPQSAITQLKSTQQGAMVGTASGLTVGYGLAPEDSPALQFAYTIGGGIFGFFAGGLAGFGLSAPTASQKSNIQPYWYISSYLELKLESSLETAEQITRLSMGQK